MTNKLVVIINKLKVQKIKEILLYEMKFLVPNYSGLQNPWLRGYRSQIPFSLSSFLNWMGWTPPRPEQNSWVRHCSTIRFKFVQSLNHFFRFTIIFGLQKRLLNSRHGTSDWLTSVSTNKHLRSDVLLSEDIIPHAELNSQKSARFLCQLRFS